MSKKHEATLTIEKKNEMRTIEIANMINEGGIGAENYYVIKKPRPVSNRPQSQREH